MLLSVTKNSGWFVFGFRGQRASSMWFEFRTRSGSLISVVIENAPPQRWRCRKGLVALFTFLREDLQSTDPERKAIRMPYRESCNLYNSQYHWHSRVLYFLSLFWLVPRRAGRRLKTLTGLIATLESITESVTRWPSGVISKIVSITIFLYNNFRYVIRGGMWNKLQPVKILIAVKAWIDSSEG